MQRTAENAKWFVSITILRQPMRKTIYRQGPPSREKFAEFQKIFGSGSGGGPADKKLNARLSPTEFDQNPPSLRRVVAKERPISIATSYQRVAYAADLTSAL
jgi:hypothetical protein